MKHSRYNRTASASAEDIDHQGRAVAANARVRDQVNIAYGTGEVTGAFVRETICLSDHSGDLATEQSKECVQIRVITATELTKEPFNTFEFDGVLGLGLASLAVDPEFSFFGQLSKLNSLPEDLLRLFPFAERFSGKRDLLWW